jgi:transcription initiation factor TFIIIB Brf1 subunit/transcription initiation factor TFIIB
LGVPMTLNDIAVISNTKPKQLAKTYRLSVVNLNLIQKVDLINIYRQCQIKQT